MAKRGRGRPAFEPTQEQRDIVAGHTLAGTDIQKIRQKIINPQTGMVLGEKSFARVFQTELEGALNEANKQIAGRLFTKAMQGDTACMIFWLKTRARWREKDPDDGSDDNGSKTIVISGGLPDD